MIIEEPVPGCEAFTDGTWQLVCHIEEYSALQSNARRTHQSIFVEDVEAQFETASR
jgi:hypothetical protein